MRPFSRLLAFLGIFLVAGMASAQGYPSKPVRLLVPFPPGGSTDMVARMISPKLGELLGQQIFVDYKGGAGGSIGAAQAARAAPDGYTVLIVTDTHAMNHHVYKVPYDFFKSLEPISLLVQAPGILVAHPGFAPSTVKELIDYARANPEKVTYGSAGVGNASHLSGFLFGHMTGVKMTHVPYKGGGPLITDLLGGHVNIAFGTLPLYAQLVRSGKLKLIAVLSKTRIPQFPDAPAAAEIVPGFEYKTWYGLLAPAGTPKEIVVRLNREMVRALADVTVKGELVSRGFDITASSPEAFAAFLGQESDVAGRLVRDLELQPE